MTSSIRIGSFKGPLIAAAAAFLLQAAGAGAAEAAGDAQRQARDLIVAATPASATVGGGVAARGASGPTVDAQRHAAALLRGSPSLQAASAQTAVRHAASRSRQEQLGRAVPRGQDDARELARRAILHGAV